MKTFKYINLILLLFVVTNISAQVTFEKFYFDSNGKQFVVSNFSEDAIGNLIYVGKKRNFRSLTDSLIVYKTDSYGVVKWSKFIGTNFDCEGIDLNVNKSNNTYTILGTSSNDMILTQLDSSGSILWSKKYGDSIQFDEAASLIRTNDGGFAFCGLVKTLANDIGGNIIIVKTDNLGNLEWSKEYNNVLSMTRPRSIKQTKDSGFIVVGIFDPILVGSIYNGKILSLKVNRNGLFQWSKEYMFAHGSGEDVFELPNSGGYLISGFTDEFGLMLKIADNGNFIAQKEFNTSFQSPNSEKFGFTKMTINSKGNYLISGGGYFSCWGCVYFLEIDRNLNVLKKIRYNGLRIGVENTFKTFETNDNGIVLANTNGYTLKLDKNGLINCDVESSYLDTSTTITYSNLVFTPTNMSTSSSFTLSSVPLTFVENFTCPIDTPCVETINYFTHPVACDSAELNGNWYYTNQVVNDTIFGGSATGCDSITITELIINSCNNDSVFFYIPNSFTPDGNNINDRFIPIGFGVLNENYEFLIFNRWGELIFSTNNRDEAWDGNHNGKLVKQDVYVWKLQYKNRHNERIENKMGHVNVLR